MLVLMKLFNHWSRKSFFASLRRSLCLFLYTHIYFIISTSLYSHRLVFIENELDFFFHLHFFDILTGKKNHTHISNWKFKNVKRAKERFFSFFLSSNRFRWHDTCFKDIIALLLKKKKKNDEKRKDCFQQKIKINSCRRTELVKRHLFADTD